ncbi:MAG TPA: hypothetical protein VN843_25435, partial [Anaerolineales bacterium]|nr:hypothetical protein [Anaerolineales bacterium]
GTPRYLTTALATLSLGILDSPNSAATAQLQESTEFLARTLVTNSHLNRTEKGLLTGAVLAGSGSIKNGKVRKIIRALARQPAGTLSENNAFFYEYQYQDGNETEPKWNRDTVYLYTEIMIGIAGLLPGAPTDLRLRAERVVNTLLTNISENGYFRTSHESRLSTVEQAWCCILLALARKQTTPSGGLIRRMWYGLVRQREGNRLTEVIFPVASVLIVAIISAIPIDFLPFTLWKVGASLVVYPLYGEKIVNKLFPGRG